MVVESTIFLNVSHAESRCFITYERFNLWRKYIKILIKKLIEIGVFP